MLLGVGLKRTPKKHHVLKGDCFTCYKFAKHSRLGANTVKRATKDVISALKNGYG